jgi:hypothetical protein
VTNRKGKTAAATARQNFKPNEKLIRKEAVRFSLPPDTLRAAVLAFGPIPVTGQRTLFRNLYQALGTYRLRTIQAASEQRDPLTASEQRDQLKKIAIATAHLLSLVGVDCKSVARRRNWDDTPAGTRSEILHSLRNPSATGRAISMRLATARINHRGRGEDEVNAELAATYNRVEEAVISLYWLHSQAELAQQRLPVQKGRGGSRNRATPKGTLIRNAIDIYSHLRKQYPGSGGKPGFGGPMLRFIRTVAELAFLSLSDRAIKEVWRVRDSSRN